MARRILFFIAILLGIAIGLGIGWGILPRLNETAQPETLRADYRTDYVLMVAEAYRSDQNASLAQRRLAFLGDTDAVRMVQEAIVFGGQVGYASADMELMLRLLQALQNLKPQG